MRATAARPVDVEGGAERLGKRGIGTGAGRLHGRSSLGELGLGEPDSGAEPCREREGLARVRLGEGPFPGRVRLSAPLDDAGHPGVQRLGRRRVLHERTVERRFAEHRGQQCDARAHPPAFLLERRRLPCGADPLVDRDQDGRADHAVPRQREAPAPVGLGEGVARAPVRRAGGQQRVATSGKRPAIDPQHLPPLRRERRGDRPALERERVAQAAEPASGALERDAVVAQEARSGDVRVVELVEQLRHARQRLDGRELCEDDPLGRRRLGTARDHVAPRRGRGKHEHGAIAPACARSAARARRRAAPRAPCRREMRASSSSSGMPPPVREISTSVPAARFPRAVAQGRPVASGRSEPRRPRRGRVSIQLFEPSTDSSSP